MPLVRIALVEGKPESYLKKAGDAVHRAMVETISIPPQGRIQIITEHAKSHFLYDPAYLNARRTDDLIIIQITMNQGRSMELKKVLYNRIAELLHEELNLRKEDVFVNLVEVAKENWFFGNSEA